MTREQLLQMALEAGGQMYASDQVEFFLPDLEKFAALIAAAEREACAKVLDWNREMCQPNGTLDMVLHACADAIRARGNT